MNDLRRLASELAHALAERRHLPELIGFVVATFRELLQAEGVAILLLDRENDELYFPFCAEENSQVAERLSAIRFPAYRGIAGKVLRTGRLAIHPPLPSPAATSSSRRESIWANFARPLSHPNRVALG